MYNDEYYRTDNCGLPDDSEYLDDCGRPDSSRHLNNEKHKKSRALKPEDYMEPACPLCSGPYGSESQIRPIPQQRIIAKMDEYMSRRDYKGAERHLLYWLKEALMGGDERGQLMLRGELVGHYRKTGEKEKAMENGEAALALLEKLDMADTVSAGTAYVNYATACNAFGENEKALALFEKARAVYEACMARGAGGIYSAPAIGGAGVTTDAPAMNGAGGIRGNGAGDNIGGSPSSPVRPDLLGGLYNNMALTYVSMGRFEEAFSLYEKALRIMGTVPGGGLEQAITYLNMANAVEDRLGMEEGETRICELLDTAYDLFDTTDAPRDGYYAFVCEKCAPTFSYYGYFLAAEDLTERAEQIYSR